MFAYPKEVEEGYSSVPSRLSNRPCIDSLGCPSH